MRVVTGIARGIQLISPEGMDFHSLNYYLLFNPQFFSILIIKNRSKVDC